MSTKLPPEVVHAAGAWALDVTSARLVEAGTINTNFDIAAGRGRFFLRRYRANLETERIEGEHELVRWATERGVPAPVPFPLPGGATLFIDGEDRWALFPWVEHDVAERGRLGQARVRALGDVHGRVQATLLAHPDSKGARLNRQWDTTAAATAFERLLQRAERDAEEPWLCDGLRLQLQLLEREALHAPEHFAALPCQMVHGDFHDLQVLFRGDAAVAVVDWEIWHTDARVWELLRSLAFSEFLGAPEMEAYLEGYRRHVQLTEHEVELGLTLWVEDRLRNPWIWWASLVERNERVRHLLPGTIAHLREVSDPAWRERIAGRLVRATCR